MLKQNKWKTILTTMVTLIPIVIGCILWNRLPSRIPIHFGFSNAADGWCGKPFAVFGLPAILAALHLLCLMGTALDPKQKNIGKKPLGVLFWVIPAISLVMSSVVYLNALGLKPDVLFICSLFVGVLLLVLGNLLPKAGQNYSFGFKLPWTLNDSQNWNRTHRVAGICTVAAGVVIIATAFFKKVWLIFPIGIAAILIPIIYSYLYYKKHS